MTKKIDIIIPAYKAQNTIQKTIASIIIQSIVDLVKITIVNDGDENNYNDLIVYFGNYVEIEEIKILKNSGPGVARQYGIDQTAFPYFTCIDADDTFANAFSLEILLKSLETNPEYKIAVGTFIEDQKNLQFVSHQNDLVWMFGKLYDRSFINKYKIRFNETRANEDNGFNTLIRLCANEQEKIMFLNDIVYYWHYKEDSITRINNAEYSYNQSFPGYTDNMIYAIKEAKKRQPFNSYIDIWTIQVMAQLYIYYLQTCKRDPRFKKQNYNYCIKYYNEVFKELQNRFGKEHFESIFGQVFVEQSRNMIDIVPDITIYQFLEGFTKEDL